MNRRKFLALCAGSLLWPGVPKYNPPVASAWVCNKVNISDHIYLLNPDGSPLTTLLAETRMNGSVPPKFRWWEDELVPYDL